MAPKGVNEKKQKGMELKAANKAKKDAVAAAEQKRQEDQEWAKGANSRGMDRATAMAEKADEQARKRAEKAALLAAEEANLSGKPVKKLPTLSNKKSGQGSKKKNNDISLLEDALVSDTDKKVKAEKRAARLKREKEERERMEKERQKVEAAKNVDPLLANTDAMIGDSINSVMMEGGSGGRLNASLVAGEIDASGIDAALSSMKLASGVVDDHPEKRMKALHKAFEEKMMPEMKQQYPGLKRSQYLEKIFILWKKSPENPMNWPTNKNSKE
eukprot:CAMPEP_0176506258 /NCGR_PEP_ID=MMETSP0200_2-20121128/16936_1 /TAXON_ID=947934 /ORGANISM="Chaetoceros sp., Strain GSL56" /LENGTH=271 /DNA_ID=CAMNT_0017905875 /DNA_START=20 /DNA_END=835 /DNA_ORIENTATION=+